MKLISSEQLLKIHSQQNNHLTTKQSNTLHIPKSTPPNHPLSPPSHLELLHIFLGSWHPINPQFRQPPLLHLIDAVLHKSGHHEAPQWGVVGQLTRLVTPRGRGQRRGHTGHRHLVAALRVTHRAALAASQRRFAEADAFAAGLAGFRLDDGFLVEGVAWSAQP